MGERSGSRRRDRGVNLVRVAVISHTRVTCLLSGAHRRLIQVGVSSDCLVR